MAIKGIALDVYGTILSSRHLISPREGLEELSGYTKSKGIWIVTSSDAENSVVKLDLGLVGINLNIFNNHFQLSKYPKEFRKITKHYKIKPQELLVVGDNYEKDIYGAQDIGAEYIHVWKYEEESDRDKFNFKELIDFIKKEE